MAFSSPRGPLFVRQTLAIARKDLLLELRTRERLVSMLVFAVLVAVVFSFALDPTIRTRGLLGAMLWVTILFAGMLGLGRSFSLEREQDALTGVLLAPVDRGALYLGKFLANLALLLATELVVFPVYGLFFQAAFGDALGGLILVVGLASVGFMALGTLFSAIAVHTRLGDTLLPILLLPLMLPIVIFAAASTQRLLVGRPVEEVLGSVRMLLAFDLVFVIVCTLVFSSVVEE
jgi:heme exporter protein B